MDGGCPNAEGHRSHQPRRQHINVVTQNVKRFTVWLHPKMIDATQPVKLIINGKPRFADKVSHSLATALESYERRADWG